MTIGYLGAKVYLMNENVEIQKPLLTVYESEPQESIFYDRHEPPFERWMEGQGLPKDASDELVLTAMTAYLQTIETPSIIPHHRSYGYKQQSKLH